MSKKRAVLPLVLVLAASSGVFADPPTSPALTLREAIARATARAPRVAVSKAAADEARADARLAGAPFRPEAWATTTPGYASGLPVAVAGRVPAIAGVEVRQTLFSASQSADVSEAAAHASSLDASASRSRAEAVEAVALAYARVVASGTLAAAARGRFEAQERLAGRVAALGREGRRTDVDVARAELEAARARQRLLSAESDADLDRFELARLVDWPAGTPLVLADDPLAALPPPGPGGALEAARAVEPERQALEREREELSHSAAVRARLLQPVVVAEAQYSRLTRANGWDRFYNAFKADDWSIGVSVAVPLLTAGRRTDLASRSAARAARLQAELAVKDEELESVVATAEAALARAEANRSLARRAEGVAEEALRMARLLGAEGRGEADEEDRAEIALADARDDVAKTGLALTRARLRLLALRGELQSR